MSPASTKTKVGESPTPSAEFTEEEQRRAGALIGPIEADGLLWAQFGPLIELARERLERYGGKYGGAWRGRENLLEAREELADYLNYVLFHVMGEAGLAEEEILGRFGSLILAVCELDRQTRVALAMAGEGGR